MEVPWSLLEVPWYLLIPILGLPFSGWSRHGEAHLGSEGSLASLASRLDFEFRPQIVWGSEIAHFPYQYSDRFVCDYTTGSQDNMEVALFHYGMRPRGTDGTEDLVDVEERDVSFAEYTDAAAMADRGRRPVFNGLGIVICGLSEGIPSFQLTADSFLMREHGPSKRDIDFSSHPEFSMMFKLVGSDPEAIRRFFDRRLRDFFVDRGGSTVRVENGVLFLTASAATTPEEALHKLNDALAVKDALTQASPVEVSSEDLPSLDEVLSEPVEPKPLIEVGAALLAWAMGAYAWYELGFEDALVMIVITGLGGFAFLFGGRFLDRVKTWKAKDLDDYEPWRDASG